MGPDWQKSEQIFVIRARISAEPAVQAPLGPRRQILRVANVSARRQDETNQPDRPDQPARAAPSYGPRGAWGVEGVPRGSPSPRVGRF